MNSATYGKTRFHFHSGLDGPVIINIPSSAFHDEYFPDERTSKPVELPEGTYQVEVPGEDLVALVLDTFRGELVERVEDADDEAMKGLLMQAIGTFSAILRQTEERPIEDGTSRELGKWSDAWGTPGGKDAIS